MLEALPEEPGNDDCESLEGLSLDPAAMEKVNQDLASVEALWKSFWSFKSGLAGLRFGFDLSCGRGPIDLLCILLLEASAGLDPHVQEASKVSEEDSGSDDEEA